jgi:hypothetical protein
MNGDKNLQVTSRSVQTDMPCEGTSPVNTAKTNNKYITLQN